MLRLTVLSRCVKTSPRFTGHCKRLAGDWGKLGEAFKGNDKVNVAHVDCTVDKETCTKFEVSLCLCTSSCKHVG